MYQGRNIHRTYGPCTTYPMYLNWNYFLTKSYDHKDNVPQDEHGDHVPQTLCTANPFFFELNPITTRTIYHRSSSDRNFAIIRNHWIHLLRQLHQHLWSKLITCHFISIIPRKKSKTTKKITQCLCNGCDVMFPGTDRWKAHFKTSPQCKDKHLPCNHCHSRFCGFNSDTLEKYLYSSKSCKRKHASFVDGTIGKLPPGTADGILSTHQNNDCNNYSFEALAPDGTTAPLKKECLDLEWCPFHLLIWLMAQTLWAIQNHMLGLWQVGWGVIF